MIYVFYDISTSNVVKMSAILEDINNIPSFIVGEGQVSN